MPAPPGRGRDRTPEQWLAATENARREARYKFAEERVRKISAGAPPLTAEQRARLASIILAPAGDAS
jgi:hypothetical protein